MNRSIALVLLFFLWASLMIKDKPAEKGPCPEGHFLLQIDEKSGDVSAPFLTVYEGVTFMNNEGTEVFVQFTAPWQDRWAPDFQPYAVWGSWTDNAHACVNTAQFHRQRWNMIKDLIFN